MADTKTFTLADKCRELKIDPKAGRRKARADFAREKSTLAKTVKNPGAKNLRWVWNDTPANHKMVEAFLKG